VDFYELFTKLKQLAVLEIQKDVAKMKMKSEENVNFYVL